MQETVFETKKKKCLSKETLLCLFLILLFVGTTVWGIVELCVPELPSAQAPLIIIESLACMAVAAIPLLVHKVLRIKASFSLIAITGAFLILALCGEIFSLYYRLSWWDSMLHLLSGFGVAFLAYCILDYLTRNSNLRRRAALCLVAAFSISLASELIWEICEYIIDSLFGMNMQKFMPQNNPFFNGGFTKKPLWGTDDEIAVFFRSPQGYRYALMDTMSDMLWCLMGTMLFTNICAITAKKFSYFYSSGVTKSPKPNKVLSDESELFVGEL